MNGIPTDVEVVITTVLPHLCRNGLLDLLELYPQLKERVQPFLDLCPTAVQMGTKFGWMMDGTKVTFIGKKHRHLREGQKVTVTKTPMRVALNKKEVCVVTDEGHIFTVPWIELA